MKYWLSTAVAAGLILAPVTGQAAKKVHRSQMQAGGANVQRSEGSNASLRAPTAIDPTGGNAAAGGNNAASMFGSNSAADSANGRTGGSGYGGGN